MRRYLVRCLPFHDQGRRESAADMMHANDMYVGKGASFYLYWQWEEGKGRKDDMGCIPAES